MRMIEIIHIPSHQSHLKLLYHHLQQQLLSFLLRLSGNVTKKVLNIMGLMNLRCRHTLTMAVSDGSVSEKTGLWSGVKRMNIHNVPPEIASDATLHHLYSDAMAISVPMKISSHVIGDHRIFHLAIPADGIFPTFDWLSSFPWYINDLVWVGIIFTILGLVLIVLPTLFWNWFISHRDPIDAEIVNRYELEEQAQYLKEWRDAKDNKSKAKALEKEFKDFEKKLNSFMKPFDDPEDKREIMRRLEEKLRKMDNDIRREE
jgi:hypothetical protein